MLPRFSSCRLRLYTAKTCWATLASRTAQILRGMFGVGSDLSNTYAHTGSLSLKLSPTGDGWNLAQQKNNFSVNAGQTYVVSLWGLNPNDTETLTGSSYGAYKIESYDALNALTATTSVAFISSGSTPGEWVHTEAQYTMPAGSTSVNFSMFVVGPTTQSVYFDDASFAAVPEPSAIVLLMTGLMGLLAYAWRKRR